MAETKGRLGTLAVDDGGGYDPVGEITDMSLSWSNDQIDKTDFDSAGYKEHDYGERMLTISGSVNLDEADAGQDALATALEGQTTLTVRYRPNEASGQKEYTFTGLVTSFEISNARNEMVSASFEIVSSGTITVATQA